MRKKVKAIIAGTMTMVMVTVAPSVHLANSWQKVEVGMSRAEAGILDSSTIGAAIDVVIMLKTKSMLKRLKRSSMQMTYAKMQMARAMELDPAMITAAKQSAIALAKTGDVVEGAKISAKTDIPDHVLKAGATKLLSLKDQSREAEIIALLNEAEAARHSARKNNLAAVGDAVFIIAGLAKRIHDDPNSLARNLAICFVAAEATQSLLKEQDKHSDELKAINTMFKERWEIKEPTNKEIKKAEKAMEKECGI